MKQLLITVGFCLTIFWTQAQNYSLEEKATIMGNVDSLLYKYMQYNSLTVPGGTKLNGTIARNFKNLFTSDAEIYDDINAKFDENAGDKFPYKLVVKSRNDYYEDLITNFPAGLRIQNSRFNISYQKISLNQVQVVLERKITGRKYDSESYAQYQFVNNDSLLLTIQIQRSDLSVKISSVRLVGKGDGLTVLNDKDLDGVIDDLDVCKEIKGKIALGGCPDSDGDEVPDFKDECPDIKGELANGGCPASTFAYTFVFSGSIGYQINQYAFNKNSQMQLGYANLDQNTENGRLIRPHVNAPGFTAGPSINANIAWYFGKKEHNRNKGIAIGLNATNYKCDYTIDKSLFQYQSNDNVNDYRRVVTVNKAKESISFSLLNFPLTFRYKARFGQKWAFEIGAGPGLASLIKSSSYSANVNFEGIYQYNQDDFIYNLNYTPQSTDILIQGSFITSKFYTTGNSANQLMNQLLTIDGGDYNFGMDQNVSGKLPTKTTIAVSLNASFDLYYHIRKKMALKAGANIIYMPTSNSTTSTYRLINRFDGNGGSDYKSILESGQKSTFTSFGINFGFILGI